MSSFTVDGRRIGADFPPLVIAEIGINHEGDLDRAHEMIDAVADVGGECVKFQTHVVADEMIPNDVVPGNATESIWDIIQRCALSEPQEAELHAHATERGLIYLSTPFGREASERLQRLDVSWFKIGSGECNNYPLIEHVASFGKPMVVSTGMNDIDSIRPAVEAMEAADVPYALLHCTSMYPTPYDRVRLGALAHMRGAFPDAVLGLSDHSESIHPCLGAVALGASILERHFTASKDWPGPDIAVSMDPDELAHLIEGSRAIYASLGGEKSILPEEQPTIDFAYACVVTTRAVSAGEELRRDSVWVKRPGTGDILAARYQEVLGRRAARDLRPDHQLSWTDLE